MRPGRASVSAAHPCGLEGFGVELTQREARGVRTAQRRQLLHRKLGLLLRADADDSAVEEHLEYASVLTISLNPIGPDYGGK